MLIWAAVSFAALGRKTNLFGFGLVRIQTLKKRNVNS